MKKRILSLALASCLCLSLFTVSASAYETLDPAAFWDALSLSRAEG